MGVLTLDEHFDHGIETKHGEAFLIDYSWARNGTKRGPPLTPQGFHQQMQVRKDRAEKKGVNLFTSGSDQPFVIDKYTKSFEEQVKAVAFDFGHMGWGDNEIELLAEVLPQCKNLKELHLNDNEIGNAGALKLAAVLPNLTKLYRFE